MAGEYGEDILAGEYGELVADLRGFLEGGVWSRKALLVRGHLPNSGNLGFGSFSSSSEKNRSSLS